MEPDDLIPILMCASCWRIQPLGYELEFEVDQWVDPTTFMARGARGSSEYQIIDGYCDPCLAEMTVIDRRARLRAASEHINA